MDTDHQSSDQSNEVEIISVCDIYLNSKNPISKSE